VRLWWNIHADNPPRSTEPAECGLKKDSIFILVGRAPKIYVYKVTSTTTTAITFVYYTAVGKPTKRHIAFEYELYTPHETVQYVMANFLNQAFVAIHPEHTQKITRGTKRINFTKATATTLHGHYLTMLRITDYLKERAKTRPGAPDIDFETPHGIPTPKGQQPIKPYFTQPLAAPRETFSYRRPNPKGNGTILNIHLEPLHNPHSSLNPTELP
jgi:hypothetical protein